jgi:hypothetical protein
MHPMYKIPEKGELNLLQGDIIGREELLKSGALTGHQDYIASRDDFSGFCVVTQSCDLVQNEEEHRASTEFICLAVVRKLVDVFSPSDLNGELKGETKRVLSSAINHNWNKRAYFYLYPEPSAGIAEDSVVDLRVMFSLYAPLHYKQIRDARRISLQDVYACMLGWMAGYLFSRIATPDWDDLRKRPDNRLENAKSSKQYVEHLSAMINSSGTKLGTKERPMAAQIFFRSAAEQKVTDEEWIELTSHLTRIRQGKVRSDLG